MSDAKLEYAIAKGRSKIQLVNIVNEWIAEGWRLQGGVCYGSYGDGEFYQAMIREVAPEPDE